MVMSSRLPLSPLIPDSEQLAEDVLLCPGTVVLVWCGFTTQHTSGGKNWQPSRPVSLPALLPGIPGPRVSSPSILGGRPVPGGFLCLEAAACGPALCLGPCPCSVPRPARALTERPQMVLPLGSPLPGTLSPLSLLLLALQGCQTESFGICFQIFSLFLAGALVCCKLLHHSWKGRLLWVSFRNTSAYISRGSSHALK